MEITFEQFSGMTAGERDEFGRRLARGLDKMFEPAPAGADVLPTLVHVATGAEFKYVPAGEFQMGFGEEEERAARRLCDPPPLNIDEMRPVRRVKIEPFLMSRLPVLNEFAGGHVGLDSVGARQPNAAAFLTREEAERLVSRIGCRLPAEQQWEYACRAGTQTLFPWGETLPAADDLEKLLGSDFSNTGKLTPNRFGLYGMFTGEWCEDEFRLSYRPQAPVEEGSYVVRGGGAFFWPWQDDEWVWCMSAMRMPSSALPPEGRCGLRLVYGL